MDYRFNFSSLLSLAKHFPLQPHFGSKVPHWRIEGKFGLCHISAPTATPIKIGETPLS